MSKPKAASSVKATDIAPPVLAMSVTPAAKSIGISKSRLYELINSGEIKAVKIGARTVVPTAELADFLSRCPRFAA